MRNISAAMCVLSLKHDLLCPKDLVLIDYKKISQVNLYWNENNFSFVRKKYLGGSNVESAIYTLVIIRNGTSPELNLNNGYNNVTLYSRYCNVGPPNLQTKSGPKLQVVPVSRDQFFKIIGNLFFNSCLNVDGKQQTYGLYLKITCTKLMYI